MALTVSAAPLMSLRAAPASGAGARADAAPAQPAKGDSVELSAEALAVLARLKARDAQVRQHEQAHLAAAGSLAQSGASYTYQRGPDGVNYAVGGEVQIDTSPGRTPEETIARAQTMAAAALAPAQPSGADRAVAAQAQQMALQARSEQAQEAADAGAQPGNALQQRLAQLVQRAYGTAAADAATIQTSA
jgi:hypothetical protein